MSAPPMAAMERIETLIEEYNKIHDERKREEESRTAGRRRGAVGGGLFAKELFVLFQIERARKLRKSSSTSLLAGAGVLCAGTIRSKMAR